MIKRLAFALLVFTSGICLQKANAQKLSFYDFRPNRDSVQTAKAITAYNIGGEKDFYLLLSPGSSLQNALAELAPALKREELTEKGNYTFDFLIDGKKVYTENLHHGAILQTDKVTNRPLDIVFASTTRSGLWSLSVWERFLLNVGLAQFGKTPKTLEIQIRAYIDNEGIKYSSVLAQAKLAVINVPTPIDPKKMVPQPIAAASGLTLSKAKFDASLIAALNTRIAEKSYKLINGIVVLKKGELLIEQYYNGDKRETLHDPRSVSKSITSTLMGMAISDGFVKSEKQYLSDFYELRSYANYTAKKDSIRLVDLLTMSSAFDGNDEIDASPGNEENMYPTPDYTKFALDLPMEKGIQNGQRWSYFTAGTHLLMDIIDKKVAGGAEAYAKRKLFDPLGINNYEWARTPQGRPFGGGGLKMRAIDFAKYGQLYANGGSFNGKQLVDKSWVAKSFSQLKVLPAGQTGYYGMLFWNKTFKVNGKDYEAYYSSGNGGNKIYVFKELNMVIVITSSAYGRSFAHTQADQILENYLLPAIL